MRTAEIFNGSTLITVSEGSKFQLNGVWTWDIGSLISFGVKQGISVAAKVISKDGSGSTLEVVSIDTLDDLAEMSVEAEDVEVETIESVDEEIVEPIEEVEESVEPYRLALKKNKFTKKELVLFIEANNLDIDTSLTKANLVSALEALDLIEYK